MPQILIKLKVNRLLRYHLKQYINNTDSKSTGCSFHRSLKYFGGPDKIANAFTVMLKRCFKIKQLVGKRVQHSLEVLVGKFLISLRQKFSFLLSTMKVRKNKIKSFEVFLHLNTNKITYCKSIHTPRQHPGLNKKIDRKQQKKILLEIGFRVVNGPTSTDLNPKT